MPTTSDPNDPERALLALLLGERREIPDGIETTSLLDLARREGVLPLLASRLLASGRIDDALAARLDHEQNQAVAADTFWERETIRVLDEIGARGIDAVVLKGMALAHSLYDAPHMRPRVDVDLLIDRGTLESLRSLMNELGYSERPSWGGDLHHSQTAFQKQLLPELRLTWDVHWLLTNRFAWGSRFRFDEIIDGAVPLPALGPSARALSLPWALLHACIHLVGHHGGDEKLIWLWDIRLLLERLTATELDLFRSLVSRFEMDEVVGQAMSRVAARGLAEPETLASFGMSSTPVARRRTARMWQELRSLPGARLKLVWIAQLLFPSRADLETLYGHPISRVSAPFFTVHRWLRGVIRITRRRKPGGD